MRPPRNFQPAHSTVINTHLISRALDRKMIFDDVAKEKFRELLAKQCAFSQVDLVTFCLMGNHFHLLVRLDSVEANPLQDDYWVPPFFHIRSHNHQLIRST